MRTDQQMLTLFGVRQLFRPLRFSLGRQMVTPAVLLRLKDHHVIFGDGHRRVLLQKLMINVHEPQSKNAFASAAYRTALPRRAPAASRHTCTQRLGGGSSAETDSVIAKNRIKLKMNPPGKERDRITMFLEVLSVVPGWLLVNGSGRMWSSTRHPRRRCVECFCLRVISESQNPFCKEFHHGKFECQR